MLNRIAMHVFLQNTANAGGAKYFGSKTHFRFLFAAFSFVVNNIDGSGPIFAGVFCCDLSEKQNSRLSTSDSYIVDGRVVMQKSELVFLTFVMYAYLSQGDERLDVKKPIQRNIESSRQTHSIRTTGTCVCVCGGGCIFTLYQ